MTLKGKQRIVEMNCGTASPNSKMTAPRESRFHNGDQPTFTARAW